MADAGAQTLMVERLKKIIIDYASYSSQVPAVEGMLPHFTRYMVDVALGGRKRALIEDYAHLIGTQLLSEEAATSFMMVRHSRLGARSGAARHLTPRLLSIILSYVALSHTEMTRRFLRDWVAKRDAAAAAAAAADGDDLSDGEDDDGEYAASSLFDDFSDDDDDEEEEEDDDDDDGAVSLFDDVSDDDD